MTDQRDILCASLIDSGEPTSEQTKARRQVTWPHNMVLNIAVTGESGAGKSSFVNAIRGLTDSDEGAAPVGKEETTMEPRMYIHPTAPNVKIWDLPGVGTKTFNASAYAKEMEFQNYDFFIILSMSRLNENDIKLASEIKKKKKNFFFICSKIDIDVANTENEGTEAKILQEIRDKCVKHFAKLGPPPVFLITSQDLNRFDFPKLADTLETVLPENKRGADRAREVLDCIDNMVLNIAVTGESGVGKSSFVNAIRGLTDDDKLAANVDENESTIEPTVYSFPTVPNVNIWDLPGMGTRRFNRSSYAKEMILQTYDFFILVSGIRFTENDTKLIEEIKKKKKNFFFVRSKIDIDLANSERVGMTEGETLGQIRDSCVKHLAELGLPPVFLITSHDRDRFDFPKLIEIVETVLLENKRKIDRGEELDCTDDVVLNIAVTGESGVGKSSFVNAIRGLTDTDKLAAKVGEGESTMKPTVYSHPTMPNVNIWDLPHMETGIFAAFLYPRNMTIQNYDLFIIISASTFSESDVKLAREIKKKGEKNILYFVRSKMDIDVAEKAEKLTEETLKETKDSCVKKLSEFKSPVFLITSHDRNIFDFPILVNTLIEDLPENRRKIDRGREILDCLEEVVLNIAVTGESGAGKSSFVNAIRGLTDTDEGAAPVGVVETTMEPTAYPHPTMPNVNIWDLPGMGTKKFDASSYVKKMKFQNYDFFIIVSATRFKENDIKLAEEIKKKEKNFYFVRSKIDIDVANASSRKTLGDPLKSIRDNTTKYLRESELGPPPVFLITSHDLSKFDFPKLVETLERDLPENKRDALVMSLPVYSLLSLEKKYKKFKKAVWALAVVSGGIGAAPVPGLSTACDIAMAGSFFSKCYHSFGLDDKSLIKLGERVNKPILAKVKESKLIRALAKKTLLSKDLIAKLLLAGAVETACVFVPVAGNIIAAGVSFYTTQTVLSKGLKELYKSAKLVIEMAQLQ